MAVTFEIEHIMPLTKGGKSIFNNLCLACPTCNRYKGAKQSSIDPKSKKEVPLFHPQEQAWVEHFAWIKQASQVKGLTTVGRATIEVLKMNRLQIVKARELWVRLQEHPPKMLNLSMNA